LKARPDREYTLLDTTEKKLKFIDAALKEVGLTAQTLHSRAEEAGRDVKHREMYDVVTARAVASLGFLCEYCIPFVKTGGRFIPLKAAGARQELKNSAATLKSLGAEFCKIEEFTLEGCGERAIIIINKISQTSIKYPRTSAQILKNPLD
ncbi:MAG: class I SAM-dependent methyltransferase, partial [Oscillospiraceae bacterium]|jgi:16S rRNA (guanine527-N7)-methyltransferase|nr:class I SAM-dependent methyltransferase [Oscillospiraceae bacterium]